MKKIISAWSRLDQIALDIEFLVISVIQGVALAALASAASGPLERLEWQSFWYIGTGFLLILIFWSGAIIHALSFIDWPLDLVHTFLYFLASFIEVLVFSQIRHPFYWFVLLLLFQVVVAMLYLYDLSLIKKHQVRLSNSPAQKELFSHIYLQQRRELKTFVPFSILYSVIAILTFDKNSQQFFIFGQFILSLAFLINSMFSFKKRSLLISGVEE